MTAAAALVADLQARGVTLEPRGDRLRVRPTSRLAPGELDRLRAHKEEIIAMLGPTPPTASSSSTSACPDTADPVATRVVAFRAQLERWTCARRTGVPLLTLTGVTIAAGCCISCGDPLAPGRRYRCPPCLVAAELVLGVPPVLGA